MKLKEYLKDKLFSIFVFILLIMTVNVILFLSTSNSFIIIYIDILILIYYLIIIIFDYIRKKKYYNSLIKTIDNLDKAYLITEMIQEPDFIEGKILCNCLYEINKSMHENVNNYKNICEEFKEYIELWCHEIKIPITTSKIIIENNKNKVTKSINEEISKIEYYIEQVLFYARSENVEKDYIIKNTNLKTIVDNVIKNNKKLLISKKIKIESLKADIYINSDSKWLEFIINQVIINSIKYSNDDNAIIKVYINKNKNNINLTIEDNGIGIKKDEIDRVFDKGFTGSNGRNKYNSTGIGLYLCKRMCSRLEHDITIESVLNKGTKIVLIFPLNSLVKM